MCDVYLTGKQRGMPYNAFVYANVQTFHGWATACWEIFLRAIFVSLSLFFFEIRNLNASQSFPYY